MSDEYEYGPWVEVPEGGLVQLEGFPDGYKGHPTPRYRIATPKPKRELVVGKWYYTWEEWRRCVALDAGKGWLAVSELAGRFHPEEIDWSVSPRDEAPE